VVIEFVATYRRWLQVTLVLLFSALFCLLITFRDGREIFLEKWQFASVVLVFLLIGLIHAILMYDAWFVRGKKNLLGKAKRGAFFLIVGVYMSVLLFLLKSFVF